jgi:hypothetical protein
MKNLKNRVMKKIFYTTTAALGIVLVMASCKDNNRLETGSTQVMPVSASEYAEFKDWKQQQQLQTTTATVSGTKAAARPVVIKKYYVNKSTPAVAPVKAKKKGWSKAAKGAVIGAGTGAAAGAILVKNNRALGAVIGGVVGGGVGYGVGRSMDKKDGRY